MTHKGKKQRVLEFLDRQAHKLRPTYGNPKVSDDEHPQEDIQGDKSLKSLHDMDIEHEIFFQSLRGGITHDKI